MSIPVYDPHAPAHRSALARFWARLGRPVTLGEVVLCACAVIASTVVSTLVMFLFDERSKELLWRMYGLVW